MLLYCCLKCLGKKSGKPLERSVKLDNGWPVIREASLVGDHVERFITLSCGHEIPENVKPSGNRGSYNVVSYRREKRKRKFLGRRADEQTREQSTQARA